MDAVAKLGSSSTPERVSGVFGLVQLADHSIHMRQACIDILCAFVRMAEDSGSDRESADSAKVVDEVLLIIAARLIRRNESSWQGFSFDFRGVKIRTNLDFSGIVLDRGTDVNFGGSSFLGGGIDFRRVTFTGGSMSFEGAAFRSGSLDFRRAAFTDGALDFRGARFSGVAVDFSEALFGEMVVDFRESMLDAGALNFRVASFVGGTVDFRAARFNGTLIDLSEPAVFRVPPIIDQSDAPGVELPQ